MPAGIDADMQAQFAEFGVQVDIDDEGMNDVPVWASNWDSVMVFLSCETQWRVVAVGTLVWLGLDYAAVDVVLRHSGGDHRTFADLCVMEAAALEAFEEARP